LSTSVWRKLTCPDSSPKSSLGATSCIAKAGKPLVRLVAVAASQGTRSLGSLDGQVVETDDCWTADPEIAALFSDGELEPRAPPRAPP